MTEQMKMHRFGYPSGRPSPRPWSADDVAQLLHMRDVQKLPWRVIDATLKRSKGGSFQKYEQIGGRRNLSSAGVGVESCRVRVSAEQEAARLARFEAQCRMTPTATFFGDPPPGYSALDQREGRK